MRRGIDVAREQYRLACFCDGLERALVRAEVLNMEAARALIEFALDEATRETMRTPDCIILAENKRAQQEAQAEADVVALFERMRR